MKIVKFKDTDIALSKLAPIEQGNPFCLECFGWCDVYGNMLSSCCKGRFYLAFEELNREERIEMVRYCENKE